MDLVLAQRDLTRYPHFRWVGNWGPSLWASVLSGYRYHDVECGFRVFFTGRRYGVAQELGIITARLGWRIDNSVPIPVDYYRAGTRIRDGFTNVKMGLIAWARVSFGLAHNVEERVGEVLGGVCEFPLDPTLALALI